MRDFNSRELRFAVGEYYSNEEIYSALRVGNAGGVRPCLDAARNVQHLAILTSTGTPRQLDENPYHDRLEGDVLIYTGAGKDGDQHVTGNNARIIQQLDSRFPMFGFLQTQSRRVKSGDNKRWKFIGLLEFLRGYREQQLDSAGKPRFVWIFELRTHIPESPVDVVSARDFMSSSSPVPLKQNSTKIEKL